VTFDLYAATGTALAVSVIGVLFVLVAKGKDAMTTMQYRLCVILLLTATLMFAAIIAGMTLNQIQDAAGFCIGD